jgi:pimeloyl-ACP methyl ester carboxylesterase
MESLLLFLEIFIVFLFISGSFQTYYFFKINSWKRGKLPTGRRVRVDDHQIYINSLGVGNPTVLVQTAWGSPAAEWRVVQFESIKNLRVITYDRSGYGWSQLAETPRTSENIVTEFYKYLTDAKVTPPFILVGHSLGALYMQHFARKYPDEVIGCYFIDPMSFDYAGINKLDAPHYNKMYSFEAGLRKARFNTIVGATGLTAFTDGLLWNPPHHKLYEGLPDEARKIIRNGCLKLDYLRAMEDEYNQLTASIESIKKAGEFPDVPLRILGRDPEFSLKEMIAGGVPEAEAQTVEAFWQEQLRGQLGLTSQSELMEIKESGHYIHLYQPKLVVRYLNEMVKDIRKRDARF